MTQPLIIYGAGKMGQQLAAVVRNQFASSYSILGFADNRNKPGIEIAGLKVLGDIKDIKPNQGKLLFAIGYSDMQARIKAYESAKKLGHSFTTIIHPKAHVESDSTLGEGCFVHAGAVVDMSCRLGPVNYLDIGVLVGERVQTGTGNYFSAGTVTGGNLAIGDGNFLGLSSVVRDSIEIGSYNHIPAQGIVHRTLGSHSQVMEARTIRFVEKESS